MWINTTTEDFGLGGSAGRCRYDSRVPMGGQNEAFHRFNRPADNWLRSRKYGKGQCRGLLSICCLSCRLRRKARSRAAPTTCRASRGDPRRWRPRDAHESWRSGRSRGQALRRGVYITATYRQMSGRQSGHVRDASKAKATASHKPVGDKFCAFASRR